MTAKLQNDIQVLSRGSYLQLVVEMTLLDQAIIRSNEAEEVLTQHYREFGERYVIPWRKTKGKLRRLVMEKQRGLEVHPECSLKNDLCMNCPSCLLFGGTGETSNAKVDYNLLSRVLGDTFISTEQVDTVASYTANAVDENDLMTGQALMTLLLVPAETVFRGVVTIRDATPELAAIIVDGLQRLTRIGASTREWGRVKTEVLGYLLGDREQTASYELVKKIPQFNPISELDLPSVDDSYKKVDAQFSTMIEELGAKKKKK